MNASIAKETWTNAGSTLTGASSADVHTGLGKPVQGQTNSEIKTKTNERVGLVGTGAETDASSRQ